MSWTLQFHRRVGDTPLTLDEVNAFFGRRAEYVCLGSTEQESPPNEVRFNHRTAQPPHSFVFAVNRLACEAPRADFPFEETPLSLEVDYDLSDVEALPDLDEVMHHLGALVTELRLLPSDSQVQQELPCIPDSDRLTQSYIRRRKEIIDTVAYFEARKKRMLVIAGGLLLTALTMASVLVLSGR